jgi:tRNA threonylcarbamoyladenosine biosynthesis protein TsaB
VPVLGVDSTTAVASVALVDADRVIAEIWRNTTSRHARQLMPMIAQLLGDAEICLNELDGLSVAIGPGSFTGIRVGLATVKGLIHVIRKPLVGIVTLDSLVCNLAGVPGIICPVIEARKNELYTAMYRWQSNEMQRFTGYLVVSPESLSALLKDCDDPVTFLGDGVNTYGEILLRDLGARGQVASTADNLPRAAQIGLLGWKRILSGQVDDVMQLKPFYLKPSAAEQNLAGEKFEVRD